MNTAQTQTPKPSDQDARVVAKATVQAAALLDVNNTILARVIGISEASVSRLRSGEYAPKAHTKPFELAVLFVRLFRGLDAIVGGDPGAARSWMRARNLALHSEPMSLIQTVQGLMQVVQYVDARRARV